jgi:hypothetical protein
MANESLIVGNSNWAVKANNLLGYAVGETSGYYVPREFNFTRNSTATYTDENGIIQTAAANIARVQDNALLLEPQRTNLLLRSEEFDNVYWSKFNTTVTANTSISPDGNTNAETFTINSGGQAEVSKSLTTVTGTSYVFSCFGKKGSGTTDLNSFRVLGAGVINTVTINWDTGVISQTGSGATSENFGNGWYRIIIPFVANSTTTTVQLVTYQIYPSSVFSYRWGAQVEAGAYATSYIPTSGATVTRLADACSKTGISSLIGQTEGVMFYDGFYGNNPNEVYMFLEQTLASGTSNAIFVQQFSNTIRFNVNTSTQQAQIISSSYNIGQRIKIAAAYKSNDFVMYINGVQIGTDTSGSVPTCTRLQIGTYPADPTNPIFIPNKGVNQAVLFKTRLSNAELAELTTL